MSVFELWNIKGGCEVKYSYRKRKKVFRWLKMIFSVENIHQKEIDALSELYFDGVII